MEPYIGQIGLFAFNYAPADYWIACNGQLLQISQYQALYALLGTTYGGDGKTTFGLPNLQGTIPVGTGTSGGVQFILGKTGGAQTAMLTLNNLPLHTHGFTGTPASNIPVNLNLSGLTASTTVTVKTGSTPSSPTVSGNLLANSAADPLYADPSSTPQGTLGGVSALTTLTGGSASGNISYTPAGTVQPGPTINQQGFSIMPPYLPLTYGIALTGIWPPRP